MELNTSQPQHSQIISKPSRNPILFIAIGVVVIVLVALGLLVWQKNQEISQALSQLADAEKQLSDSLRGNSKQSGPDAESIMMSRKTEDEQKIAAELVAGEYACSIRGFACNKSESNVKMFQKVTDTTAGYAKVSVVTADGANTVTPWLIHRAGGSQWIVFYEGEAMPSPAVQERFPVPTDFLAVD